MKTCSKCTETKPTSEFNRKGEGFQSRCRSCSNASSKAHFEANKEQYRDKLKERKVRVFFENRQRVLDYLLDHPCVDCGEADPVVLQFDHQRDKRANISFMVVRSYSWKSISEEIDKCDVRCANCHARRTAEQFGWFKSNPRTREDQGAAF